MKEKLKLTEVRIKLALIFIFGFFYVYADSFPEKSKEFPQLIAAVSLILVIISLILDFVKKEKVAAEITDIDDSEVKVLSPEIKIAKRQRFYKAWAIIFVSAVAGFLGGFLFSTFFFFLGFSLFFGPREKLGKNIIVSVGMTILVYISFEKIMNVPLLQGLLW
jgi:hypothetical protein